MMTFGNLRSTVVFMSRYTAYLSNVSAGAVIFAVRNFFFFLSYWLGKVVMEALNNVYRIIFLNTFLMGCFQSNLVRSYKYTPPDLTFLHHNLLTVPASGRYFLHSCCGHADLWVSFTVIGSFKLLMLKHV